MSDQGRWQEETFRRITEDWHRKRQEARRQAKNGSLEEFSDQEIEKYDLDTARVSGRHNPETFETDPRIAGKKVDIRDHPRH